jgi:hypothetical protein
MKTLERSLLVIGIAMFGVLVWKMDAATVAGLILRVGWGMALILPQEAVAHVLNALGWRFAFAADRAGSFPLRELIRLRIAGDAINYLTPSGTIGGEIARTAMLNKAETAEVRTASVLVAKCTQTLGQVLFIVTGLVVAVIGHFPTARRYGTVVYIAASGLGLALAGAAFYQLWVRYRHGAVAEPLSTRRGVHALAGWLRYFFVRHPGRFVVSTLFFFLGYAWGTFEAYWICRFLGVPVSVGTAIAIETLSATLDSVLFMVPAKVGTQEGGKTAIFATLGLPSTAGLAFGIVRHVRELVWAGVGLLIGTVRKPSIVSEST